MVTINGVKISDVGFYINLDKRVDRKEIIENQFKEFKIEGIERFSAVSHLENGPLNCKRSHYKLFENFVNSKHQTMLVLEDDCKFLDFLQDESKIIFSNINKTEWDLFWLGCRNRRDVKPHINNCYFVSSVSHSHSYLITKNFAKHILDTYPVEPKDRLSTTSIDELLCLSIYGEKVVRNPNGFGFYTLNQPLDNLKVKYKSLCYEKSLTTQYSSYSDLWGYVTDWETYMTSSFPKK